MVPHVRTALAVRDTPYRDNGAQTLVMDLAGSVGKYGHAEPPCARLPA